MLSYKFYFTFFFCYFYKHSLFWLGLQLPLSCIMHRWHAYCIQFFGFSLWPLTNRSHYVAHLPLSAFSVDCQTQCPNVRRTHGHQLRCYALTCVCLYAFVSNKNDNPPSHNAVHASNNKAVIILIIALALLHPP